MNDLVVALGLVFVIEGLAYAAFPGAMRAVAAQAQSVPDQLLRITGLAALAFGVFVVWLARG